MVIMGKLRKAENEENKDNSRKQGFGLCSDSENNSSDPIPKESLRLINPNSFKKCQNDCLATSQRPCEFCSFSEQLRNFYEWFPRLGEQNKRVCLLGLVHRLVAHPVLLRRLCEVLLPTTRKDFMYASSRSAPSLETDSNTVSRDRTLTMTFVNKAVLLTWDWYEKALIWSKVNFLMIALQSCDVHLLHAVNNYAKALLDTQDEQTTTVSKQDSDEANIQEHVHTSLTEIESLNRNIPCQDAASRKAMEATRIKNFISQLRKKKSTFGETYSATCQYKDFIYCLPAHLAKYILSLLDEASLTNAVKVSKKWRQLTKEVIGDSVLGQQVREEAMVLQGTSSHGVNPTYAKDVDVPVPNVTPKTWNVIYTDEPIIKTNYRSEANFTVAYSGISTRKVIMEERNIYCGAYNVMVLKNVEDHHRVVHTDGGELVALGSKDRKVRFINSTSGKDVSPVIKGHAGSIKCVCICEKKMIVLSGSYDTSIRCWSIDTGQCLRIFRGHRDTVVVLMLLKNTLASGSKDGSCKVWDLETGKCLRTFRHSSPVHAIAMSTKVVLSGCDGGKVNVWHMDTGQHIKKLIGHSGPVTSIKFDRWHIVTGSKDGYAMVWNSLGDHARCLRAFKHPKEVRCVNLAYVRVITGSNDGRIRIWNLLTGQCCRIMRGNSYSDPILHLIPIGNRIMVNTHTNLLVLQFEDIEWNYDLENDSLPPLIKYGSYSDVPIQKKTYSYVRAKRMEKVGASNTKILQHPHSKRVTSCASSKDKGHVAQNVCHQIQQLDHSARLLSAKSLAKARFIQQFGILYNNQKNAGSFRWSNKSSHSFRSFITSHSSKTDQCRSVSPVRITDIPCSNRLKDDSKVQEPNHLTCEDPVPSFKRRSSWAFDKPKETKEKDASLSETKNLLRSQIRTKGEVKVPDFVYKTMKAYHKARKCPDDGESFENRRRPLSSPSKIDARTKVWINHLQLAQLRDKELEQKDGQSTKHTEGIADDNNNAKSMFQETKKKTITTKYVACFTQIESHQKMQTSNIKSTIPQGWTLHPVSTFWSTEANNESQTIRNRPHTTFAVERYTGRTPSSTKRISSSVPNIREPVKLVQSNDYAEKVARFRAERKVTRQRQFKEMQHGKVTPSNDPMRSHINFYLRTQEEEEKVIDQMRECEKERKLQEGEQHKEKQQNLCLEFSKGNSKVIEDSG